jgi:CBS domain-containing protein
VSPRRVSEGVIREAPVLRAEQTVREAVEALLATDLPALPVVEDGKLRGIFGEREFMGALFPGYLKELSYAGYVPHALDEALEKRAVCAREPVADHMLTEHVDVGGDFSDVQVAETFLHHRVLVLPVVEEGAVTGVITRSDFFRSLAASFLSR